MDHSFAHPNSILAAYDEIDLSRTAINARPETLGAMAQPVTMGPSPLAWR